MTPPPSAKGKDTEAQYITLTEVAKRLDLSRTRVVQLADAGELDEVGCIGIRIVTVASVEELKKERKAAGK